MRITLFILLALLSCDRIKDAPYSIQDLASCYRDQSFTNENLTSKLLDRWAWKFVMCGGCEGYASDTEEKRLEIELGQENLLEIYRAGNLIYQGEWRLEPSFQNGYFRLIMDPFYAIGPHVGLHGDIIICDNDLLFFGSATDGFDNFFQRIVL
ncbi:MAG: hypothetical protein WAU36_16780 [Cyclobacteriaceae bacterium]